MLFNNFTGFKMTATHRPDYHLHVFPCKNLFSGYIPLWTDGIVYQTGMASKQAISLLKARNNFSDPLYTFGFAVV